MLKVSRDSAEQVEQHGPVEDRHQAGDGYTINFVTFGADVDGTPLLKGLPNDSCHCPHWGYVLKGRMTYHIDGGEDVVVEAGDAFYMPPGHIAGCRGGHRVRAVQPDRAAGRGVADDDRELPAHAGCSRAGMRCSDAELP